MAHLVLRGLYLLAALLLLAWLGAYSARSHSRLVQLANWPEPSGLEPTAVGGLLPHAGTALTARRVVLFWEQPDEPHRNVLAWSDGGPLRAERHPPRPDADTERGPAPSLGWFHTAVEAIGPDLAGSYGLQNGLVAPFATMACSGYVFFTDLRAPSEDLLALSQIAGARIAAALSQRIQDQRITAEALAQERVRVKCDIHDDLLQVLAAVTIRLETIALTAEHQTARALAHVSRLVADEQHRIREALALPVPTSDDPSTMVPLADVLGTVTRRSADLWSCRIRLEIEPRDAMLPRRLGRDCEFLLNEAVANACKHGAASLIRIEASLGLDELVLSVVNDPPAGVVDSDAATIPRSLQARLALLEGSLTVFRTAECFTSRFWIPLARWQRQKVRLGA